MDRIVFWSPTVYETAPYPSGVEFRLLDNVQPELTQNSIYLPTGAIDDVEAAWQFSWDRLSNTDLEALRRVKDLVSVNDPLGLEIVGYIESIAPTGLSGLTDDTQDTWYRVDVVFNVVHMQWPAFLTYVRNDERVLTADSTHGVGEGVYPPIVVRGQDVEVTDMKWLRFYGGEAMPWANHQLASSDIQKRSARTLPAPSGVEPRWLRLSGQQVHPQVGSIYTGMRPLFSDGGRISFLPDLVVFSAQSVALQNPNNADRPQAMHFRGGQYNTTQMTLGVNTPTSTPVFDMGLPWTIELWVSWDATYTWSGYRNVFGFKDPATGNCLGILRGGTGGSNYHIRTVDGATDVHTTYPSNNAVAFVNYEYHHLRATYDGTDLILHMDNVAVTSVPITPSLMRSYTEVHFGKFPGFQIYGGHGGFMDDIRFWRKVVTGAPDTLPIPDPVNTPDLVHYFKLDTIYTQGSDRGSTVIETSVPDAVGNLDAWLYDGGSYGAYQLESNIQTAVKFPHILSGSWRDLENRYSLTSTDPNEQLEFIIDQDGKRGLLAKGAYYTVPLPLGRIDSYILFAVFEQTYPSGFAGSYDLLSLIDDGMGKTGIGVRGDHGTNLSWLSSSTGTTYVRVPDNKRCILSIFYRYREERFVGVNNSRSGWYSSVGDNTSTQAYTDPTTSRELRLLNKARHVAFYEGGIVLNATRDEWQTRMDALVAKYGIV